MLGIPLAGTLGPQPFCSRRSLPLITLVQLRAHQLSAPSASSGTSLVLSPGRNIAPKETRKHT